MCSSLSCVWLFVTPWTIAHQAPLSMAFSRQEYWSGLPCPPPGDLPYPGIESRSPTLQADSLLSEPPAIAINTCNKTGEKAGHQVLNLPLLHIPTLSLLHVMIASLPLHVPFLSGEKSVSFLIAWLNSLPACSDVNRMKWWRSTGR